MANEEQLSILKQGVEVWNRWREENPLVMIDLSSTDLREANLSDANFGNANLVGADLKRAKLQGANLDGVDLFAAYLNEADLEYAKINVARLTLTQLSRANLFGTEFNETIFKSVDLKEADLGDAILLGADLNSTDLEGSRFSSTQVGDTIFRATDLSQIIDIDTVKHIFPSSITIDTIKISQGKIPDIFLRGCGLSDAEIEYAKLYNPNLSKVERNKILSKLYDLQASQAIQFTPVFISYSHADHEFVNKLGNQLNTEGVRFWRDIHDMKSGRMEKQIEKAIRQNPTVLLVLSEHSLNSDWVEHEVRTARVLEKEMKREVLCPVALDDSWKEGHWPRRVMEQIMEYNILDFSDWKDDSKFDSMFRKLIDGLELFYRE